MKKTSSSPSQRGRQRADTAGSDEKRERILKVAERLFAAHGYDHTTMAQIVEALGVSKPYVYYYFRDKQEIFETLSWRPTVACFTVLDFPEDDVRPAHFKVKEGLEQLIRETINHYPSAFFAYRDPQAFRPEMRAAQKKIARYFHDRLYTLLETARSEGTLDFNDTRITALAACSIPGFLYAWYHPRGRFEPEEVVQELSLLAWRVIGLRRARGPARSSLKRRPPGLERPVHPKETP